MSEALLELIKETISKIKNYETRSRSRNSKAQASFEHAVKIILLDLWKAGIFIFATLRWNQKSSSLPTIDLLAVRADFLFLVFKQITILGLLYCSLRSFGTCLVK